MELTTVLFDLDGTLIDSDTPNDMVVSRVFEEEFNIKLSQEELSGYRMSTTRSILESAAPDRVDELMHKWPLYFSEYSQYLEPYPGIRELLGFFRQSRAGIGVVTLQNRSEVQTTRKLVDLEAWVDHWVAADDVEHPKPNPAQVLHALKLFAVPAEQAIFIGDSPTDLEAGRRAGVHTAAALWGCPTPEILLEMSPDFVFESPLEVEELWRKMEKAS